MRVRTLWIAAAAFGLAMSARPAAAQFFDDDGNLSLFSFHRYGGDVNRPGWTPDRPYWHGDDAVPLALRWHDKGEILDQYGNVLPPPEPVASLGVGVAGGVALRAGSGHRRITHHAAHRRYVRKAIPKNCIPAKPASQAAAGVAPAPLQ